MPSYFAPSDARKFGYKLKVVCTSKLRIISQVCLVDGQDFKYTKPKRDVTSASTHLVDLRRFFVTPKLPCHPRSKITIDKGGIAPDLDSNGSPIGKCLALSSTIPVARFGGERLQIKMFRASAQTCRK